MTIPELEEQIAVIEDIQKKCGQRIQLLMNKEDMKKGLFFAQEIHELHQTKNMLETHKQFRRVRINRLKFQNEQ